MLSRCFHYSSMQRKSVQKYVVWQKHQRQSVLTLNGFHLICYKFWGLWQHLQSVSNNCCRSLTPCHTGTAPVNNLASSIATTGNIITGNNQRLATQFFTTHVETMLTAGVKCLGIVCIARHSLLRYKTNWADENVLQKTNISNKLKSLVII